MAILPELAILLMSAGLSTAVARFLIGRMLRATGIINRSPDAQRQIL